MAFPSHFAYRIFLLFTVVARPCYGSSNTISEKNGFLNPKTFREDIVNAMDSILYGGQDASQIKAAAAIVTPMWETMPKTNGRIDRRSLRYLTHRYFMQSSSLMVRGFEPSRMTNESHWASADVLSQLAPAYVESVLESKHASLHGFTKEDVIDMVLTLNRLITDSHMTLLQTVYERHNKHMHESISLKSLMPILEEYTVKWMVEAEPEDYAMLLGNRTLAGEILPHYDATLKFVEGRAKMFEYSRANRLPKGRGRDIWKRAYSFEDVHEIVGGITNSFQAYWQSECDSMKNALVSMDKHATGRVPLTNFYNKAINTDWRFGESEAYLREMGALDETSKWIGPQVVIPNYIQATSNCIISSAHYLVCCANECETLLGEIELAIKTPVALPERIVEIVRNMTSQTTLDSDEPAHVDPYMISQLEQIAKNSGGTVPLHGRLFSQWLHYVFPRECPFPHKAGSVTSLTPTEYGDQYVASHDTMHKHALNVTDAHIHVAKEDLQWMSQWSPDEELLLDYQNELGGSCWRSMLFLAGSVLFAAVGIWQGVLSCGGKTSAPNGGGSIMHAHLV